MDTPNPASTPVSDDLRKSLVDALVRDDLRRMRDEGTLEGFVMRMLVSGGRGYADWPDGELVATAADRRLVIGGIDLLALKTRMEGAPVETYHVEWHIDVDATDTITAAREARSCQRDQDTTATVFNVQFGRRQQVVDLSSAMADAPDERAGPGANL